MLETTNYDLKKYEGSDIFNPIQVENANADAIDGIMHTNELNSVPTATHILSGNVHAITRSNPDARMFVFVATADFTYGDSFTVDGIAKTAKTTSGEQLNTHAFVDGANVLGCLEGTELTLYVASTGTAPDSDRLGGELPSYYATQADMTQAQTDISNNASDINTINGKLSNIISNTLMAGATTVTFIDARITTTSLIEPWQYIPTGATTDIIAPTAISISSGQCTLTFDAQENDVLVGIRVF